MELRAVLQHRLIEARRRSRGNCGGGVAGIAAGIVAGWRGFRIVPDDLRSSMSRRCERCIFVIAT